MKGLPAVTAAQMTDIDRIMSATFGVKPIQLMEQAGLAVARFARRMFPDSDAIDRRVVAVAGSGGNGGDALVAARLLAAWGAKVTVALAKPADRLTGLTASHLRSVQALGIPVLDGAEIDALPVADLVIDGLLGSGAAAAPSGATAHLVELVNAQTGYVLAIDLPSGLDATTGAVHDPCVVASTTLTLGLAKTGLLVDDAVEVTGSLVLVDIGIPPAAYREIGITVPDNLFSASWLVPLRGLDSVGEGALRDY